MSSPLPECLKRIGFDHIKRRNLACTVLMGVVVVCGVECCWPLHANFFFLCVGILEGTQKNGWEIYIWRIPIASHMHVCVLAIMFWCLWEFWWLLCGVVCELLKVKWPFNRVSNVNDNLFVFAWSLSIVTTLNDRIFSFLFLFLFLAKIVIH